MAHSPAAERERWDDELTERLRTGAPQGDDLSGDVRHEAIELQRAAETSDPSPLSLAEARSAGVAPRTDAPFEPPETILVWRRSLDGSSSSCSGRVDEIPFEEYVRGVLPHEWIPSWHEESLKAGAVAIRTYAAFLVESGGRYDCAHVDDTTSTQVYEEDYHPRTDEAVLATEGLYVVDEAGELILAEYSAENGDPTEFGVTDSVCSGETVFGHGRGTCQWGSQRWATSGRSFDEIVTHYYPGSSVVDARQQLAAKEVARDVPTQLVAGQAAPVEVRFENAGVFAWTADATMLATAPAGRESEFYDELTWTGGDRAAPVAEGAQPGDVGTFAFSIRAPEVTEPVVYEESFQIEHEGQRFGPVVRIEAEVVPRADGDGGGGDGDDPDHGSADYPPGDEAEGSEAPVVYGCQLGPAGALPSALVVFGALFGLARLSSRRRVAA